MIQSQVWKDPTLGPGIEVEDLPRHVNGLVNHYTQRYIDKPVQEQVSLLKRLCTSLCKDSSPSQCSLKTAIQESLDKVTSILPNDDP